jgi:exo-1,4-beta-D-glucosaminidase
VGIQQQLLTALLACAALCQASASARTTQYLPLEQGWSLQSSAKLKTGGEVLSTLAYHPTDWQSTTVPNTVVSALVANKVYPDPYFGKNLRSIPGATYPIGENFSNLPMPADSPFGVSWWYRHEFTAPEEFTGKRVALHLDGVNYRANVWINGNKVADSAQIVGTWRLFEIDVTKNLQLGTTNVLAIQVFPPSERDLAITFVDWNPLPPDKNMGLWRAVYMTASGPVTIRHPFVETDVNLPKADVAELTVRTELHNSSGNAVKGTLTGAIGSILFSQPVELSGGESKEIVFTPEQFPQLLFKNPRLWWPAQMGTPELYDVQLDFKINGSISDTSVLRFGIREVTSELDQEKKRLLFKINGKPILIRGGGWSSNLMMRYSPRRMEQEVRYAQDMGLNTIRLEGKLEPNDFFDLTDKLGILVMAGWCCCDHWEKWEDWDAEDHRVAEHSQRDQLVRLRAHPSVLAWLNASDMPPTPKVEKMYIAVLKEIRWPNPYVSSATAKPSEVTGPTGVKMNGPYDWVPPAYWLSDPTKFGGAWSFATEIGADPMVPGFETIAQMIPGEHQWPFNDWWTFHAGGNEFKNINIHVAAQDARHGKSNSAREFTTKAELMAYEGVRAMFEGFSRNKYNATGVIQWMMNDAWPSIIWHQYDFYLRPLAGYFGTKKATEPLHPIYSYNDGSVWLVSSIYKDVTALKVTAKVLDLKMEERFSKEASLDAPADSSQRVLTIPKIAGLTSTYFVLLTLDDAAGKRLSSNLYWLSNKPETLAWDKSEWYYTPAASYADFSALNTLPKVRVKYAARTVHAEGKARTDVTLENHGKTIAFFVRLKLLRNYGGQEVLPILWNDNYLWLMPGEKRQINATYEEGDVGASQPQLVVDGWNLAN